MRNFLLYIKFAIEFAINNKSISHIKYFGRWYKDMKSGKNTLILALPWMTYDAIDFLRILTATKNMKVFEWGSGGSTLFFASRAEEVVTVEHDKEWGGYLKDEILKNEITNVSLNIIEGEPVADFSSLNQDNPDDYISRDKNSKGLSFEKYVKHINRFNNCYFDIVVVDGRARSSCIKQAIPHIKKDGYLVVDNAERNYYLSPFPELNNTDKWEKTEFNGPVFFQHAFSKTIFFKKLF